MSYRAFLTPPAGALGAGHEVGVDGEASSPHRYLSLKIGETYRLWAYDGAHDEIAVYRAIGETSATPPSIVTEELWWISTTAHPIDL